MRPQYDVRLLLKYLEKKFQLNYDVGFENNISFTTLTHWHPNYEQIQFHEFYTRKL